MGSSMYTLSMEAAFFEGLGAWKLPVMSALVAREKTTEEDKDEAMVIHPAAHSVIAWMCEKLRVC